MIVKGKVIKEDEKEKRKFFMLCFPTNLDNICKIKKKTDKEKIIKQKIHKMINKNPDITEEIKKLLNN